MKALGVFLLLSTLLTPAALSAPTPESVARTEWMLHEVEGSGAHGDVMLIDLPAGGTLAVVNVAGLAADEPYRLVRLSGGSCDIESYDDGDVIATVTGNASGRATETIELSEEIAEIGSISVWTAENELVGCARIEP
jgi:hypothetical protein